MPLFDLFGLGKSAKKSGNGEKDSSAPATPAASKKFPLPKSKRAWGALLGANALLVVACAGYITVSVLQQRSAAAPKGKAVKAQPKKTPGAPKDKIKAPDPAEGGAKAEEKKPTEKIEKKIKTEKKSSPAAAKKIPGPTGSPAVHAPDLPQRSAKPKATTSTQKKAPEKTKTKKKPGRVTKPVTFEHGDPNAKKVSVVGMFLVSSGGSKTMFKGGGGVWQITVYLKRDVTYRYQFEVIDQDGRKTLTPVKTIRID